MADDEPAMRFRQHRGSLEDAMATLQEIRSDLELRWAIEDALEPGFRHRSLPDRDIMRRTKIALYDDRPDTRIGWAKTWLVTVDGVGVVGYCDRSPFDLPMFRAPEVRAVIDRPANPMTGAEFVAAAQAAIEPRSDEEIAEIIRDLETR